MDASNKIDYIEIPTKDIQKTQIFFESLFGWRFESFGPDYIAFNDGRLAGGFYKSENVSLVSNGAGLTVFYAKDLESKVNQVKELGGNIVKSIFSFPGGRRFHFTDPGGSEFAIWSE